MPINTKIINSFISVTIFFLIFLCFFELGSNVLYYAKHGHFFYGETRNENTDIPQSLQVAEAVFHPYLAFINRVGRNGEEFDTNNHGWQFEKGYLHANRHCCDYPFARPELDDLIIGVFGGSVASGFALSEQNSSFFRNMLNELPEYKDRDIYVLNFAMSGFKQPQQLLTLSYYISLGQQFDIILNIDGFNEVVTFDRNWREGAEPAYPADTVWGAMGRQVEQTSLPLNSIEHLIVAYHQRQAKEHQKNIVRCVVASCYGYNTLFQYYHLFRSKLDSKKMSNEVNKVSLFPTQFKQPKGEINNISEYTAENWLRASMAMSDIAKGNNAEYIHVLQPNQWYEKSGDYQPIDPNHIYDWIIDPVNKGYAALLKEAVKLKDRNINFFDATMVFTELNDSIYIDDCCHYTDKGNEILSVEIVKQINQDKSFKHTY